MTKLTRIFLVRHGESKANVDKMENRHVADHAIELSPQGHVQAQGAGRFLCQYFNERGINAAQSRLWVSPYKRTQQTANGILAGAGDADRFGDRRIEISLREQQFGLFDGFDEDEWAKILPVEHAAYKKACSWQGRFYAQMPDGESRCQVAERVKPFFGTLHRDAEGKGIDTIVAVSHGVTIRAFIMQYMHEAPEWFDSQKNPGNCSVQLIERDANGRNHYKGYIYTGAPHQK